MKKRNTYINPYLHKKPKGFSIIEFMVASLLSIIILIAVGAGYFSARKVNDVAVARLSAQQDIRNASNMIVYDARMAGSFGCFNLSNYNPKTATADGIVIKESGNENDIRRLVGFKDNSSAVELSAGVKTIGRQQFDNVVAGLSGFTAQSDALVFQYGEGSPVVTDTKTGSITFNRSQDVATSGESLVKGTQVVAATCNTLNRFSVTDDLSSSGDSEIKLPSDAADMTTVPLSEVSLSKYVVNIYVVGTQNGQQGLYRIRLNADNGWDSQLLLPNVNSMDIFYTYVTGCPSIDPAVASDANEKFEITTTPEETDATRPLAGVRLRLNGNELTAEGQTMASAASKETAKVYIYNIDANIRGGNQCANR